MMAATLRRPRVAQAPTIDCAQSDARCSASLSVRSISPLWPAPALQAVESVAKEILDKLRVGFEVGVKTSWNLVPARIEAATGVVPSGAIYDGQYYLFADSIISDLDAFQTVFHELFHLGLSTKIPANAADRCGRF